MNIGEPEQLEQVYLLFIRELVLEQLLPKERKLENLTANNMLWKNLF
jgi:hypothetical protein